MNKPWKCRHKGEFLEQVRKEAPGITKDEVESTITAVSYRLPTELPGGEVHQVRDQLPAEVRELWALSDLEMSPSLTDGPRLQVRRARALQ